MKNVWVIVILSVALFSFDLPKSGVKKMDKTLAKLWPEQTVSKSLVKLSEAQKSKLSFKIDNNTLYKVSNQTASESYIFVSKGFGKMNEFDYMVIYNKDLSILKRLLMIKPS